MLLTHYKIRRSTVCKLFDRKKYPRNKNQIYKTETFALIITTASKYPITVLRILKEVRKHS